MNETTPPYRTGFVSVVGRPNVGKSTLVNRLVGQKVSITSPRPQTTRHVIRGILTSESYQCVFVDTPGFQTKHRSALNRMMNRGVTESLKGVDVALFVIEACRFGAEDRQVLSLLPQEVPVILVINKIDRLSDRRALLPFIDSLSREQAFAEIFPVSAANGQGMDGLTRSIVALLPEGPPLFEPDDVTDRSERFLAAEIVREKLFRLLGQELPYGLTVEIEQFKEEGRMRRIHAAVVVDRPSHKPMVIGESGRVIKEAATRAREELEQLFGSKVFLEVWVKVKGGWADDERALKSLGYE